MEKQTFARRLKQLREAASLTQQQLAERAGLNQYGVAKLEQGVREPGWSTVQALARALGVTCSAFEQEATPAGVRELALVVLVVLCVQPIERRLLRLEIRRGLVTLAPAVNVGHADLETAVRQLLDVAFATIAPRI